MDLFLITAKKTFKPPNLIYLWPEVIVFHVTEQMRHPHDL